MGLKYRFLRLVGLVSQAEVDLSAFEAKCQQWPLVRECHMLNGEVDFVLKCVAPDLRSFQRFLTEDLTSADNVASVKTSLVIRGAKDEPGVPFDVLEARLAKKRLGGHHQIQIGLAQSRRGQRTKIARAGNVRE